MPHFSRSQTVNTLTLVGLLCFFVFVCVIGGLFFLGASMSGDQLRTAVVLVLSASIALSFPIGTAMLDRPYDIFHPLNFVALSLFFGVFGRTLFLLTSHSSSAQFLLDDRGIESLLPGAALSCVGSFLLCLGYLSIRSSVLKLRIWTKLLESFQERSFMYFLPIFLIIGAIATVLFLSATGFQYTGLSELSEKRRVEIGDNELQAAMGYHRLIAQDFPRAVLLVLVTMWGLGKRGVGLYAGIFCFGILAVALPFLASSRTGVLMALLSLCVAVNLTSGIRVRSLIFALVISLTVIFSMLALRRVNSRGDTFADAITELGLEPLFGNRNFADITKLSHVYDAVPEKIPYKYGSSYFTLLYAPIPRTWWPEKPAISMGYELTQKLYDRDAGTKLRGGGTPPGLFAESLINFGIWGFPFAVFIAGAGLRLMTNSLRLLAENSIGGVAIYSGILPAFCLMLMSGDFTRALMIFIGVSLLITSVCMVTRIKLVPTY